MVFIELIFIFFILFILFIYFIIKIFSDKNSKLARVSKIVTIWVLIALFAINIIFNIRLIFRFSFSILFSFPNVILNILMVLFIIKLLSTKKPKLARTLKSVTTGAIIIIISVNIILGVLFGGFTSTRFGSLFSDASIGFHLLALVFIFLFILYSARYIFKKIEPSEVKKIRIIMIWVIVVAILSSIYFGVFLYVNNHFFEFMFTSMITIAPLALSILLSANWLRDKYRDDKLHHYNGYAFILALMISSSFALLSFSSPHGWLIPHIEMGIFEVTEDGVFEYRMEFINNGRTNARARFLAIHLETGQETVIKIPNDELRTLGGPLTFSGSPKLEDPETSWGLAPWDGTMNLIPTTEPMVFNIEVFIESDDGVVSERWLIRHLFMIYLDTGEITLVEATFFDLE